VPRDGRSQARVAVAARLRVLAEVPQQLDTPARDGLAEGEHRIEVGARIPLELVGTLAAIDEAAEVHEVAQAVRHPRGGRQTITTGSPGLLVVALDALGQVQVRDEPDVRLVDAHPERDRRDDDDPVLPEEALLMRRTHTRVESRVVRQRAHALIDQPLSRGLDALARQAVDDARVPLVLSPDEAEQLVARTILGVDPI